MLGRQQDFIGLSGVNERRITRIAGCTLKACAGLHLDADDLQRHAQRITDRLTVIRPRVSRSLEAVMDMDGAQWRQGLGFGERCEKVQKDGGIEATGEGDVPMCSIAPRLKI
ncbi:hypothetical protein D3C84_1039430 [compost metagenome]